MKQKIMAGLLSVCLLAGLLPTSVLADPTADKTAALVCTHHPVHTEECGYQPACDHEHTEECYEEVEECVHKHTAACYEGNEKGEEGEGQKDSPGGAGQEPEEVGTATPAVATEKREQLTLKKGLRTATPPVATPSIPESGCQHVCTEENGCITKKAVCVHAQGIHDASCNYEEGKEEKPCQFVCPICPIQERINGLPDIDSLDELSEEEQTKLYEELKAILSAMEALKPEERAQLLTERLDALAALFPGLLDAGELDQYTVQGISPSNVTVNLFDYWQWDEETKRFDVDAKDKQPMWTEKDFASGINTNHAMRFYTRVNSLGDINKYTGAGKGPQKNIVADVLGTDGYPKLSGTYKDNTEEAFKKLAETYPDEFGNLDLTHDESLAYLFDPDKDHLGKKAFKDVKGLFLIDDSGNYYYDSTENFAEFVEAGEQAGTFKLYTAPGVPIKDKNPGQFFPFNQGSEVLEVKDGELVSKSSVGPGNEVIHHYFGVSMEATFQQPEGGYVSNGAQRDPMKFEFSGDDDIWIFIDGVLVADLGGVHDKADTSIDFSTGKIIINGTSNGTDTLRQRFVDAGKADTVRFDGDTFAEGTQHVLQVFYLERGNWESNLKLSFNLLEARSGQIVKVDQDGDGLDGVTFELYETGETYVIEDANDPIATFTTRENGLVPMEDSTGVPISFNKDRYYVLREVSTRPGFVTTGDLKLRFKGNGQLHVENQWETGAVAGFEAQIYHAGKLKYNKDDEPVKEETARGGLILAVPLFNKDKLGTGSAAGWQPMYGSVTNGFHLVPVDESPSDEIMRKAILEAVMLQSADDDNERWHLDWVEENQRYEGTLVDLPGSTDRYVFVNETSGDLLTAYYLLEDAVNIDEDSLFDDCDTEEEKHDALQRFAKEAAADETGETLNDFIEKNQGNIHLLNLDGFNRQFYTRLYIPNQVRELRVLKQDDAGKSLAGAEFGLYEDKACTDLVARGITGDKGMLTFSAQNDGENSLDGTDLSSNVNFALSRLVSGNGRENRSYWLKEMKAPVGYEINETPVEVRITADSIYVNAGAEDDGVSVRKGVGKLLQTVARYAASEEINVTLRDITATMYVCDAAIEGENLPLFGSQDWKRGDEEPLSLHYGLDTAKLDYGLHDPSRDPYFTAESGWVGFGVEQNFNAHKDDDEYPNSYKEELNANGIKDLSALLTGTTTAVVKNEKTPEPEPTGTLTITKTVEGKDDTTDAFEFTVTLTGEDLIPISGTYGDVTFANGIGRFTLRDGQQKVISGIPLGTSYEVAEKDYSAEGYTTTISGNAAGTITADAANVTVAYTNTWIEPTPEPKTGTLTVTKTVAGEQGETDREFHFTVTLTDADQNPVGGTYGGLIFTDGTAEFALKHGASMTISGLPVGATYKVEEAEANQDGYTTEAAGDNGSIIEGEVTASFINTKEKQDPGPGPDPEPKKGDLTVSKIVAGNDGEKDREFHFTVILNEKDINGTYGDLEFANGIARFTLKDGDSKTASGLPVGTAYKVEETEANQDGYTTGAVGDSGTIIEGEKTASFTNTREKQDPGPGPDPEPRTGNLTVSKTVSGSRGDKSKEFTFTVTLGDTSVTGDFGAMHFAEGAAVFKLKHGDSVTASGLPADVRYTVSESDNAGYTVTASGEEGVIEAGKTAMALFNNYRGGGGSSGGPSDPGDRGPGGENPTVPEVTLPEHPGDQGGEQPGGEPIIPYVELDRVPKTGDTTNLALWLWLLGLSSAGVLTAFGFYMRRRKSDRE